MNIKKIKIEKLNSSNPFVTSYWAKLKATNSWLSEAFSFELKNKEFKILVLYKKLFFNEYLAYIPFSPVCTSDNSLLSSKDLKSALKGISKITNKRIVLFKVDLPFGYKSDDVFEDDFIINKKSIQPDITIKLNLEKDLDQIQLNYRKVAKRKIKKNKNIIVVKQVEPSRENIDLWYSIYEETAKRDNFKTRSVEYINSLFEIRDDVKARLILSFKDGEAVGGIIILTTKTEAVYLFGASKILEKYSPSYSMQNYAIELCHSLEIKNYDFFGIGRDDKSKHLKSLTFFKSSFGGEVFERVPTLDYPIHNFLYKIYKIAEKARFLL